MGYKNREIEVKLIVDGVSSMKTVNALLEKLFPDPEDLIIGKSKDVYFPAPADSKADFARVRYYPDRPGGQMTIKYTDKGSNVDRVEIDVHVDDCDQAVDFLTSFTGKEQIGTINKRYIVYFLDKRDTTVSLYQVVNDSRVFLEIEARSLEKVNKLLGEIKTVLPYSLTQIHKSLYQLFVEKSA